MNAYESRQAARKEHQRGRAAVLREKAAQDFRKADLREEVSGIPFGQPILVGHHSERHHRRAIERADAALRRGIEAEKKAKELERRADSTSNAISSDDEDATTKLRAKIAKLETKQANMKAINKLVRAKDTAGLAALVGEARAAEFMTPDFCGRLGCPSYMLTNNNANIRRLKQRLETLERAAATPEAEDIEGDGFTVHEDKDDNRIHFIFPGKPAADIRAVLKGHGFKWSPSRGAWVRMLNSAGRYAAQLARAGLATLEG